MTTDTTYPSVLLIYTGGTIGMIRNSETGALESFTFDHLVRHIPELKQMQCRIDSVQFEPPIDSSDMDPSLWVDLARIIHVTTALSYCTVPIQCPTRLRP